MKKVISATILLALAQVIAACNTVEGVGRDIKSGGQAIERAGRN